MHPIYLYKKLLEEAKSIPPEEFKSAIGSLDESFQKQYASVLEKGLKSIELTNEEKISIEKLLTEKNYPVKNFNLKAYTELLFLTRLACKFEGNVGAEQHAMKLALMFADSTKALNYLFKFQDLKPRKQLIHDACLFEPPNSNVDYPIWQSLAIKNMPHKDFEAILPHAKKIQQFVEKNRSELEKNIWEELVRNQEILLSKEYDQKEMTESDYVKEKIQANAKKINREIKAALDKWAKEQLKITHEKLNPDEQKSINEFCRGELGKKEHDRLMDELNKQYIEIFKKDFKDKSPNSVKAAKIKKELEKLKLLASPPPGLKESKSSGIRKTLEANFKTSAHKIYSKDTDLETLLKYAANVSYARSSENIAASKLFFTLGVSEESFNKYLDLKPCDNDVNVPNVFIDGKQINYPDFYIKKLSSLDPKAAVLGKLTSCCQSLGGAGEAPAIYGIENPHAGFYILCKKKSESPTSSDPIMSQCLAWRGAHGDMVFDSVESQVNFREANEFLICHFYTYLAQHLVKACSVSIVLVGTGGETPDSLGGKVDYAESPLSYAGYRDSHRQRAIAAADLVALWERVHNQKLSESKISEENIDQACKIWAESLVFSKETGIRELMNVGKHLQLSEEKLLVKFEKYRKEYIFGLSSWTILEIKELLKYISLDEAMREKVTSDKIGAFVKSILEYENAQYEKSDFEKLSPLIRNIIFIESIDKNKNKLIKLFVENHLIDINSSVDDKSFLQRVVEKFDLNNIKYFVQNGAIPSESKINENDIEQACNVWAKSQVVSIEVAIDELFVVAKHLNFSKEKLHNQLRSECLLLLTDWSKVEIKELLDYIRLGLNEKKYLSKDDQLVKCILKNEITEYKKEDLIKLHADIRNNLFAQFISENNSHAIRFFIDNQLIDINANGKDSNLYSRSYNSFLSRAVEKCDLDIVKYFVKAGVNTNDEMLIHHAIRGDKLETAKYIEGIQGKVNINFKRQHYLEYTTLAHAVLNDNIDAVNYLIQLKAEIDIYFSVRFAAMHSSISILKILLEDKSLNVNSKEYFCAIRDARNAEARKLLMDRREKAIPPHQLENILDKNLSNAEQEKKIEEFRRKGEEIVARESKELGEAAVKEIAKQIFYYTKGGPVPPHEQRSENILNNKHFAILVGMGKMDFKQLTPDFVRELSSVNLFTEEGVKLCARGYVTIHELFGNTMSHSLDDFIRKGGSLICDKTPGFRARHFSELDLYDKWDVTRFLLSHKGKQVLQHDLISLDDFLKIKRENREKCIDELAAQAEKLTEQKEKSPSSLQETSLFSGSKNTEDQPQPSRDKKSNQPGG